MPLTVSITEDFKDSREIHITHDTFTQRFKFHMCGNFIEEATDIPPYGPADDVEALKAAYNFVPSFLLQPLYDGVNFMVLVIKDMTLRMIQHDEWEVDLEYGQPEEGEQGSGGSTNVDSSQYGPQVEDSGRDAPDNYVQLGFNVSSSTSLATRSLTLINQQVPPGVTPPVIYELYKGAPMGQTRDGVEGKEIYNRGFSFNVTCYKLPTQLSFRYARKLFRLATTLNDRPFFGFPPGSVLFLEAQAQGDIYSVIPLTFEFQMRPNIVFTTGAPALMDPDEEDPALQYDVLSDPFFAKSSDLSVSTEGYYKNALWRDFDGTALFSSISSINGTGNWTSIYSGWDDIDYRYAEGVVDAFGLVIQKPIMRLIHNNYYYSDFADLELGHVSTSGGS